MPTTAWAVVGFALSRGGERQCSAERFELVKQPIGFSSQTGMLIAELTMCAEAADPCRLCFAFCDPLKACMNPRKVGIYLLFCEI